MSRMKTKKPVYSLGYLGEPIYAKKDNFDLDPHMPFIQPSCSELHDPHVRDYYYRKDKLDVLKNKTKEITEDNKVKCTFREYKMHQRYLEQQKLIAERGHKEMERAKMRQFLEQQQEGHEMTLSDLREQMLDEYVECLRPAMKAERIRWGEQSALEDGTLEMDLLSCKAEKRTQLCKIQSEVQCEWNREKRLREEQERKERQKYAAHQRRTALQKQRMLEQVKRAEKSSLDKLNKKPNLPGRSNITTKNPDARRAVEQRPMKPQIKVPVAQRCWR